MKRPLPLIVLFASFAICPSTLVAQLLPDRSSELQARIDSSQGNLILDAGTYVLDRSLQFDLSKLDGVAVKGNGSVTLIMRGPGPALRFVGTHEGTANPSTFKPQTWKQRMPLITDIEIVGAHADADGIELVGTVQAIVDRVAVRHARHGIRLRKRNRNVIISNCHLYENSGVGLYLDDINLHQINVANSHISYNRQGGVVVRDGQVRNLHITGCDIEGNMPADATPTRAANVWIDLSARKSDSSVAEVAITGCTIQHSSNRGREPAIAPGGANIRIEGRPDYPVDTVTIGNNILSDASIGIDIHLAKDVALTGNAFFTSMPGDLRVERSQRILVTGNTFNPRQDWSIGGIVFRDSNDCIFNANTVRGSRNPEAAILLERCEGIRISDCILSENDHGIVLRDSIDCEIVDTRIKSPRKGGQPISRVNSD